MTWLSPILAPRPKRDCMPPRKIVVEGVRYRSVNAAMRALGCSATKVYRLMGESWRLKR